MSSFKRKGSVKQASVLSGTRLSPATPASVITSTGIPSLDDILGGGLPLSCSVLIVAPDLHSSYGDLVQKYFIAQGLSCRHRLYVIEDNAEDFVTDIMWKSRNGATPELTVEADEKSEQNKDQKIKIAWRYEQLKPFQTTVPLSSLSLPEDYCHNFDLTSRVPPPVIENALRSGQLSFLKLHAPHGRILVSEVLNRIKDALSSEASEALPTSSPIRICIPALGSPQWGELDPQGIIFFLHSLRSLLREHPHACASISLAPHITSDEWGGSGWLQKLGWVTDAAFTLSAFSADPSLTATFPNHHGFLYIHALPAPYSIIPPSDKFSTLRGLSASAGGTGGSGENNLTFKSTRKRLIFETLHLDIEGGVGERRTTAPLAIGLETPSDAQDHFHHTLNDHAGHASKTAFAAVEVVLEDPREVVHDEIGRNDKVTDALERKSKKPKKKVAFRADRPDLYDF